MASEELPTLEAFCLEVPLYKRFSLERNEETKAKLKHFFSRTGPFDCYCIYCGEISVFRGQEDYQLDDYRYINSIHDAFIFRNFQCQRNLHHKYTFLFKIMSNDIFKIGQFPSMADIATAELQQYHKTLGNEKFKEFSRAVGLISHGVGIGAFVYLRRIFEELIEEAHETAKRAKGWDDDDFKSKKMEQKIELLHGFLPRDLVDNRSMFEILSIGIHEMSEDDCLRFFPVLKEGIEFILDEKIAEKKREERRKRMNVEIGKVAGEVRKRTKKETGESEEKTGKNKP